MRILVSNDDGIFAPGIKALAESLAREHEVYVVAPDRERSATGHALTLHKPLRAEEVTLFEGVAGSWQVNGTPSDCVKLAFGALLDTAPQLVVSGINRGPNLGTDVIYSGTVSAALEGAILGAPAVAFSLASFDDLHYATAAHFALEVAEKVREQHMPSRTLLNINVPSLAPEGLQGVRVTKLGIRKYNDVFEPRVDMRGKTYYWLAGEPDEQEEHPDTDVMAVRSGQISITPIHIDLTLYPLLDEVERWGWTVQDKVVETTRKG